MSRRKGIRPLLVVMNPRQIDVCVNSIAALPTERVWLRGWTETEIEREAWPVMMRDARGQGYSHLAVVSDDGRVTLGAWNEVCRIAERGHPVVTGWSNLDLARGFEVSNMVKSALPPGPQDIDQMTFYTLPEILEMESDEFPTSFHGYSLTMMTWQIAEEFPFRCFRVETAMQGHSSDFHHSRRLADAGIDIVGARDAFVPHMKQRFNRTDRHQFVYLKRHSKEMVWQ